jgi:hypothetical protein
MLQTPGTLGVFLAEKGAPFRSVLITSQKMSRSDLASSGLVEL